MIAQGFDASYLAYLTFTFILVVTPGSTTAVVVRNTLEGGRRAGYATAFGAALANTIIAIACGLGLSVLLAYWPGSIDAIRIGGAVFLAWLGAASLLRAWREPDGGIRLSVDPGRRACAAAHRRLRWRRPRHQPPESDHHQLLSVGRPFFHSRRRVAPVLLDAGGLSRHDGVPVPFDVGDGARCDAALVRRAVDTACAASGDGARIDRARDSRRSLDVRDVPGATIRVEVFLAGNVDRADTVLATNRTRDAILSGEPHLSELRVSPESDLTGASGINMQSASLDAVSMTLSPCLSSRPQPAIPSPRRAPWRERRESSSLERERRGREEATRSESGTGASRASRRAGLTDTLAAGAGECRAGDGPPA